MSDTSKTSSSTGGVGFFGLLTVLFIALKLTGYIQWPWWQVLLPLWAPLAFVALLTVIYFFITVAGEFRKARR